jgi:hypothetical protein
VDDAEREARDCLIDAARTDVVHLTEGQTDVAEALDRLNWQAEGDADRLRGAAEQLRRRFAGAEAIPLLEAAARHTERDTAQGPPRASSDQIAETSRQGPAAS